MEEDAEGMLRPKPKKQPMPKLRRGMGDLGCRFLQAERNRAGRTPRAEGSRHEHGRAEHALRGAKASRRWCDAKTCEGSFRETNVER